MSITVTTTGATVNCSALQTLNDFGDYVDALRDQTDFNTSLLEACRMQICNAVYGNGNADISGIGVVVGYICELALGIILSIVFLVFKSTTSDTSRARAVFTSGLSVFYDSAAYFAIAIQLATIALLVRKDFGISTADFGAIETQISQAVSVICVLPLLYPAALLAGVDGSEVRQHARLFLLNMVIALSFYPFLSRCMHDFETGGGQPIGTGEGAKVSPVDWEKVEDVCFQDGLDDLRDSLTYKAVGGLELGTTIIIYLFSFWLLASLLIPHYPPLNNDGLYETRRPQRILAFRKRVNDWFGDHPIVTIWPLFGLLGLSVPMMWVIWQLRKLQRSVAKLTGEGYADNTWGFGQIVSVVIFAPVVVEMLYGWRFGPEAAEGGREKQN